VTQGSRSGNHPHQRRHQRRAHIECTGDRLRWIPLRSGALARPAPARLRAAAAVTLPVGRDRNLRGPHRDERCCPHPHKARNLITAGPWRCLEAAPGHGRPPAPSPTAMRRAATAAWPNEIPPSPIGSASGTSTRRPAAPRPATAASRRRRF